jgi:energy-coupling factor transport system permease protein
LTTNPLILALVAAAALAVAVLRRVPAAWALTLRLYVWLAAAVVVVRVGFRVVFGAAGGGLGPVALALPAWHLPVWPVPGGAGLVLFGPVTWDGLYLGFCDGLRLACLILAVGAANVLASPKRVLAALPGALRQVGTAVVVALTVFPSLALSVSRVRRAARLRGPAASRRQAVHRVVFPVLADSLDRSLELAASLESRGYGAAGRRVGRAVRGARALASAVVLAGMAGGALGVTSGRGAAGWPVLAASVVAAGFLLRWLGADVGATRLRREGWSARDWLIAGGAAACALGLALSPALTGSRALHPGSLGWPPLPWPALAGLAACVFMPLWAVPASAGRAARPTSSGAGPTELGPGPLHGRGTPPQQPDQTPVPADRVVPAGPTSSGTGPTGLGPGPGHAGPSQGTPGLGHAGPTHIPHGHGHETPPQHPDQTPAADPADRETAGRAAAGQVAGSPVRRAGFRLAGRVVPAGPGEGADQS